MPYLTRTKKRGVSGGKSARRGRRRYGGAPRRRYGGDGLDMGMGTGMGTGMSEDLSTGMRGRTRGRTSGRTRGRTRGRTFLGGTPYSEFV